MSSAETAELSTTRLLRALLPQMLAVCVTFLLTGAAFAAVPLFVARGLGQGPAVIGFLTGLSFLFSIVTRLWAGSFADSRGPKWTILAGLGLAIFAGLFSGAAWVLREVPAWAVAALIAGRVCLGGAEGIVMVSGQTWALAVAGTDRSGLVIGWVGTAMFVAMALGAPVGGVVYAQFGFGVVALVMILAPLPLLALIARLPGATVASGQALVVWDVLRRIALHCGTMALVGIGYGTIVSFSVLLFEDRGWTPAWAGLTLFSFALVVARVFAGSAPDRFGGTRTALWSLTFMTGGFAFLALTFSNPVAYTGAFLAGAGYALVYPALAREMLKRVPARNRGSAMALYASTISLVLGIGSPLLGMMAERLGTAAVFGFAGAMSLLAMAIIAFVMPVRATGTA